ncbi:MAG: NUDIX hydrolase [Clostridia bacterium]|nr:NUDIX hydrolase [Clostridia bacterium]
MGYISDIRKKIGHDPLMIVGASVIVTDAQGRVLLQHRADNGLWGYHGGCVELGENTEAAARREMLEETGLTAGKMTLLGVFSGPEMRYTYPNGDQASVVDIVYLCDDYSGEMRPQPEEVTELRWFAPADIPADDQLSPPNIPALRMWQRSPA